MESGKSSVETRESAGRLLPHSCVHCRTPLRISSSRSRPIPRILFPQTSRQAREAYLDGCTIFKELIENYSRQRIWQLIKKHYLDRCDHCRSVRQRFEHVLRSLSRKPFTLTLEACPDARGPEPALLSFAYLDSGNGVQGRRLNAYTYTGDNVEWMLPSIDLEVHSSQTILNVKQWLSNCTCVSSKNGDGPFRPTRIIDLGGEPSSDGFAVKKSEETSVPAYVCLSYCWGDRQSLYCSSRNIDSSGAWNGHISSLPAAFQDTFSIARELGFRYLWIDSLCIVQDDNDDMKREILQMPLIYKNAELTICASSTESCREGFLQSRPDYSEYQIPVKFPDGRGGTVYLDSHKCWLPPATEPLGTRAWAYQERLLSPRLLEYGWRTVRWSCSCCTSYGGHQRLPSLNKDSTAQDGSLNYNLFPTLNPLSVPTFPRSREELFQSWKFIVEEYSTLKLTFADDRLAAIGGVAQELRRLTGIPYLAGLWNYETLPSLLQWRVIAPPSEMHTRPRIDRTPSWSWAGLDNAVSIHCSEEAIPQFRILTASAVGGFGKTAHGSITIHSLARSGRWWCEAGDLRMGTVKSNMRSTKESMDGLVVWPDCADEIVTFVNGAVVALQIDLTFIAVGIANWDRNRVRGLILQKGCSDVHTRVGFFHASLSSVRSWQAFTVEIV
ncbi:hypothetical protein EPUS_00837 [Endocarpon pusillum Z07020]|uniref:Heterokaryon incompatibility domain-containing protein n=1 Tax=Endocarpon pusillum (strain Z07020 / HMAS-L-300199) TaxID=1263415 RepID=U1GAZ9_ENDPU|nr:uncharacterized protein EPUS_00837 [Endocarpon pusillum Z07020]ERF74707.1 hypothetical protein EPUS_00837 [Endocarpon pusillum Z07020]